MGGTCGNGLLERGLWREIDRSAKRIGEAVFDADHIEQGEMPGSIKFCNQVDEFKGLAPLDEFGGQVR